MHLQAIGPNVPQRSSPHDRRSQRRDSTLVSSKATLLVSTRPIIAIDSSRSNACAGPRQGSADEHQPEHARCAPALSAWRHASRSHRS